MAEKLRNIIEEISRDFLESSLGLRYDICTCSMCKNDMLAFVLSRVPAKYVTTEQGALHTVMDQARIENRAEIARAVISAIDIISKNPRHKQTEDREKTFKLLLDKIFEDRGVDFRHYREEILKRRVAIRMRANNISTYSEYLRLLMKKPEEYDKLFETLCINVTEFFRDKEVWVTLRYLFDKLIQEKIRKNDFTLKVWSAGCATGEEPYSLAILLTERLKLIPQTFTLQIIATDIDPAAMKAATIGKYAKEAIKNVEDKYVTEHFKPAADNSSYRVKEEIKKLVEIKYLDLTSQELIPDTDIVICRNVFIYFGRSLQEQLLMKFYKSLKTGGYLIMGKAEIIFSEAKEIFKDVDLNARIYQKRNVEQPAS